LSDEEGDRLEAIVASFCDSYPQYVGGGRKTSEEREYAAHNYRALIALLQERDQFADDPQALVRAFEDLAGAGKLYVDLSPLGLGERIITGYALDLTPAQTPGLHVHVPSGTSASTANNPSDFPAPSKGGKSTVVNVGGTDKQKVRFANPS
jgi:hypothetical protein